MLFVELNQEATGIPSDGALVDLVSDDEDIVETNAGEVKKKVMPGDEEEEGAIVDDRPPEQAAAPSSSPPSA